MRSPPSIHAGGTGSGSGSGRYSSSGSNTLTCVSDSSGIPNEVFYSFLNSPFYHTAQIPRAPQKFRESLGSRGLRGCGFGAVPTETNPTSKVAHSNAKSPETKRRPLSFLSPEFYSRV